MNIIYISFFMESELVSGFMTEHAAVVFVFFFLAEYGSILLMCILVTVLFLGGYNPSMFSFDFDLDFFENWRLRIELILNYNEYNFVNDTKGLVYVIKELNTIQTILYIITIPLFIINEIFVIIYDIIILIVDSYKGLEEIVNYNQRENEYCSAETLLLQGLFIPLIIGIKSSVLVFCFVWIRASFPRIRFDQLMQFCWTVLLPLVFAFILLVPCALFSFDIYSTNISI